MKKLPVLICVSLFSVSSFAAEPPDIRPGLWKNTYKVTDQTGQVEAAMAQMKDYLAQLPPEERKMVEEMMASQSISNGLTSGTSEECVTAEQISSGSWMSNEDECEEQVVEQTRKKMRIKFSCKDEDGVAYRGEGEINFLSPTRHTSKMVMYVDVDDVSSRTEIETSGEWLAADCGDVEPDSY